jgi:hypothetical protein
MGSMALVPQINKCHLPGSMPDASYYFCILISSKSTKVSIYIVAKQHVGIKRPWARLGQIDHKLIMVHEHMMIIILITTS